MSDPGPMAASSWLGDTARAYSALFFLDNPAAGALLLAGTFVHPNVGSAGLLGALTATAAARWFGFPSGQRSVLILNSLLVGLSLGAFYRLDGALAALVCLGSLLAVITGAALGEVLWRQERLPVLVIPFLLVATITALAAREMHGLTPYAVDIGGSGAWLPLPLREFFSLLGSTFFTAHPAAGAIVLGVMLWRSRYLALLAVAAVITGQGALALFGLAGQSLLVTWAGFNLALTAIAIGGIYTVPGVASFATAMLAAVLAALVLVACQDLLFVHRLPLIALPYVTVTLVFLMGLRTRLGVQPPWLAMQSGMPEQNYERARLARVRNGAVDSVPLLMPMVGQWQVYQGFDGEHTHRPPWQHAVDFYITEAGKSYRGTGESLEDYYCFGLPVVSPAHGLVVRVRATIADNRPGEVDTRNNWGNFVLLRLDNGLHLLLSHLKQDSLKVGEGDRVRPGKVVGACGNSGRSPQPHLHLQVQRDATLGSPTRPFHLCSLMHHGADKPSEYLLHTRPRTGDSLEAAVIDPRLSAPLHLPVGRRLTYEVEGPGMAAAILRHLTVELTLTGQFRLVSDTGASTAFEESNGVLACYDRLGPADRFLDIWLLACGLTPLSGNALAWSDEPSALLLPLPAWQQLLLKVARPLGRGLQSRYRRQFCSHNGIWRQQGWHELRLGATLWQAETECLLDPVWGFRELRCRLGAANWRARLTELGLASDEGVPGWQTPQTATLDAMEYGI